MRRPGLHGDWSCGRGGGCPKGFVGHTPRLICARPAHLLQVTELPFGIPLGSAYLPFEPTQDESNWATKGNDGNYPSLGTFFARAEMYGTSSNDDDNWVWSTASSLKMNLKVNASNDGGYMFTFQVFEQSSDPLSSEFTFTNRDPNCRNNCGPTGYQLEKPVSGELGQCTATFHLKCQEKYAKQAHRNQVESRRPI